MSHSVLNTIVWILSVYMSWFLPLLCPCLSPDPGQNWVCCDLLNHTPWPKGRQSSNSISVPLNSISVPGYKEKIDYWYHTCVHLNLMSRNSLDQLVVVSNPIPSSLRRQNLSWHYSSGTGCPSFSVSHWIFISWSLMTSHNSSFEQNWLHSSWSQSVPSTISVSTVRSFMCLSVFPCTLTSCIISRMHALCETVTTSFCPRNPSLWMWLIVYFGSSPFQLLPHSACAFWHKHARRRWSVPILLHLLSTRKCTSHHLKQSSLPSPWYRLVF